LYKAFSVGQRSPLPELAIQYGDFACWQRLWLGEDKLAKQVAYWSQKLTGDLPALALRTDYPRPASQTFRGAIQPFALSTDLREAAWVASQRGGVTLFITLLSVFYTLLHRYTGQRRIVVGTVAPAGRKHSEAQGLLGYFLNPVALLVDLSDNPTFYELQQRARDVTVGALCNDDVPFEYLVENLRLLGDPNRHPVFQVAISLEPSLPVLDSEWSLTTMDVASGGARWDLYLVFDNRSNGILGRMQYNPDLFDVATIMRLVEDFRLLLGDLAANPLRRVAG
jgi:non-ribosomal peptide synthetase component F